MRYLILLFLCLAGCGDPAASPIYTIPDAVAQVCRSHTTVLPYHLARIQQRAYPNLITIHCGQKSVTLRSE